MFDVAKSFIFEDSIKEENDKYHSEVMEFYQLESMYYDRIKDDVKFGMTYPSFYDYYSSESAFTKNPSVLRSAFLRLYMTFSINKELVSAKYLSFLENLSVDAINPSPSKTLFNLESIKGFTKVMELIEAFGDTHIPDDIIRKSLEMYKNDINSFNSKMIYALLGLSMPFANLIALVYLINKIIQLSADSADLNSKYGESLTQILFDSMKRIKSIREIPGINLNDKIDSLGKINNYLNKIRNEMFPSKIKRSIKPKLFLRNNIMNYEEKKEAVIILKENHPKYQLVLLKNPGTFIQSLRGILLGSEIDNQMFYGVKSGSDPLTKGIGDFLTNLLITLIETNFYIVHLVDDLKRY